MDSDAMFRRLAFGLNGRVPVRATAAWGARWIAPCDQVWDRKAIFGGELEQAALYAWLNGGALRAAMTHARLLHEQGPMDGSIQETFVLFADMEGVILGDTCASYGYVYVCAMRYADVADYVIPDDVTRWSPPVWATTRRRRSVTRRRLAAPLRRAVRRPGVR